MTSVPEKRSMTQVSSKRAFHRKWVPPLSTQNGERSFFSSGFPLVDLSFGLVRGASEERVHELTRASWTTPFPYYVPGLENIHNDELRAKVMTLRCLFHTRDIRNGGAGQREVFINAMAWIAKHDTRCFIEALKAGHFEYFGCWRDLTILYQKVSINNKRRIVRHCVTQLLKDLSLFEEGKPISQCAKWMPSEGQARDKDGLYSALALDFSLMNAIRKVPFKTADGRIPDGSNRDFRKTVMSPLRSHINIVEKLMSEKQWDRIDFSRVPSKASMKYVSAFRRHCPESVLSKRSEALKCGKKPTQKPRVETLYPHEIIESLISGTPSHGSIQDFVALEEFLNRDKDDEYDNIHFHRCVGITGIGCPYCKIGHIHEGSLQEWYQDYISDPSVTVWQAYVASLLEKRLQKEWETRRKTPDILVMADTSRSMMYPSGKVRPINVAIGLAMLFSEVNRGPFGKKWINFSSHPTFQEVKMFNDDGSLTSIRERVQEMKLENSEETTNIQGALELILETLEKSNLTAKTEKICPEMLVVVSDKQFDSASKSSTNFDAMRAKFSEYGASMPLVVFWNLSSTERDVPVAFSDEGFVLMSGLNPKFFDMIFSCDREKISPLNFVITSLSTGPFRSIELLEEEV